MAGTRIAIRWPHAPPLRHQDRPQLPTPPLRARPDRSIWRASHLPFRLSVLHPHFVLNQAGVQFSLECFCNSSLGSPWVMGQRHVQRPCGQREVAYAVKMAIAVLLSHQLLCLIET